MPGRQLRKVRGRLFVTRFVALFFLFFFLCAWPALCQSNSGELRLKVVDSSGLGVKTTVRILSEANQYRNALATSDRGALVVQRLPYGIYQLEISQPGFAVTYESIEIRSSIPLEYAIQLKVPTVSESVTVS